MAKTYRREPQSTKAKVKQPYQRTKVQRCKVVQRSTFNCASPEELEEFENMAKDLAVEESDLGPYKL